MEPRDIVHQFNNVLMGIGPHVEVIKRAAKDNQRILDSIAHIEAALKRGKELTASLKDPNTATSS